MDRLIHHGPCLVCLNKITCDKTHEDDAEYCSCVSPSCEHNNHNLYEC